MTRVTHYDRIGLKLDASTVREIVGGDLLVDGIGAHSGLYTYHDEAGAPFVEYVPTSTLLDPKSLATAAGSDVNIQHPDGLVTEDNYRDVTHGVWVRAWDAGEGQMGVRLRLKTAESKAMVRDAIAGKSSVELSPAYEVDVDAESVSTPYGRADGTQTERVYNAMAMLDPGQARGGRGMRLQLDARPCAPKGCRVQSIRHQRRDGATSSKRDHMKVKLTHTDGRSVEVDAERAKWLRLFSLDSAAAKKANADQIETGTISIMIEGEEATELTLPVSMIEMMLEGIGGGSVSAAPAAPEGMEIEEEQMEGMDADDDKADRGDSKLITMGGVEALIAKRVGQAEKRRANMDATRRRVERDAAAILPAEYSFGGSPWNVAQDALAQAYPAEVAVWRKRTQDAANGDREAIGRVLGRLELLASCKRDGKGLIVPGDPPKAPEVKGDSRGPWETGTPNTPSTKETH